MVGVYGDATSLAARKRRAGQRLLIGWRGQEVTDDLRRVVAQIRPAGFLWFGHNVIEPAQVLELNRELTSLVDPHDPALLAVDQEGGRVQRIGAPATEWPDMRIVGEVGDRTGAVAAALALELRAMGLNLNLAPVADLASHPDNPIIGARAFGAEPGEVARHVATFVEAHQREHVIACVKHFPGHGDTAEDSHQTLPTVACSEAELRAQLVPFEAAIAAGVGAVMTAHVTFPAIDPGLPATLSERVLPRLLRDELGYDGVIVSDDLEMVAIAERWSPQEQVIRATRASVDLLVAGSDPEVQIALFEALVHAQEHDQGMDRASEVSTDRIEALRERFFLSCPPRPPLEVVGQADHRALASELWERVR
ncbi:MAG TPA: glycoside hydrolase family 3 protein [Deltaproteobacteria bacterium]|nr:glycoside hydrolase family 3 protein [Deltaproteobacteria bacterium]